MSDPHESEKSAGEGAEGGSAVRLEDAPDHTNHETDEASGTTEDTTSATSTTDDTVADRDEDDDHEVDASDDDHDDHDDDDDLDTDESRSRGRGGLFAAIGVAAVAVIAVLVLLAAYVWPNFMGPGSPDETAGQAVSALSSKDAGRLQQVSCQRQDGKPSTQVPPELLQLIQSATPSGPVVKTLDSEARQAITITIAAGGQPPQSGPVEVVLAVNHGNWCMNSISAAQ